MADAADVFMGIERLPGVIYSALVPNRAGLERAQAARVDEVAIFAAASETFSRRNINQSIADSMRAYRELCGDATRAGYRVRAYLSTVFGCPFEGDVAVDNVLALTADLLDMGAYEVALSDTIGIAHPGQVTALLGQAAGKLPLDRLALHFHDTRGTALVNVYAALEAGITTFDASAGGLGGCPYAPGATGNLATEDLVYMLDGLGITTGVHLDEVMRASRGIEPLINHPLPSRVYRAAQATRR
jgi:hydroxymethylglutaryl-CoA lyase